MVTGGELERRLLALERDGYGAKPLLVVKQDWDDPTLYHGFDGGDYHEEQLPALAESRELCVIEYVADWSWRAAEDSLIYGELE